MSEFEWWLDGLLTALAAIGLALILNKLRRGRR